MLPAFDGLLPESAVFDGSSRRLAVANFGDLDDPAAAGSIDFWRVVGDVNGPERLQLVKTAYALPIQRRVHTLTIVRSRSITNRSSGRLSLFEC